MIPQLIVSYVLLFIVTAIDCFTGPEARFGSLYLLLIAVMGWRIGVAHLFLYASVTLILWVGTEILLAEPSPEPWVFYWNIVNKVGSIAIGVFIIYKVQTTLNRQLGLIRELRKQSLKITQFSELIPVCRFCHKVHLDDVYRANLEKFLEEDPVEDSVGDICPHCQDARSRRLAAIPVEAVLSGKN